MASSSNVSAYIAIGSVFVYLTCYLCPCCVHQEPAAHNDAFRRTWDKDEYSKRARDRILKEKEDGGLSRDKVIACLSAFVVPKC